MRMSTERVIYLLLILCHAIAMRSATRTLYMHSRPHIDAKFRNAVAAAAIAASCISVPYEPSVAAPTVSNVGTLEETISRLEAAETRADTVQGLADVFEAAGAQTLRARTKFKYVIEYFLKASPLFICNLFSSHLLTESY